MLLVSVVLAFCCVLDDCNLAGCVLLTGLAGCAGSCTGESASLSDVPQQGRKDKMPPFFFGGFCWSPGCPVLDFSFRWSFRLLPALLSLRRPVRLRFEPCPILSERPWVASLVCVEALGCADCPGTPSVALCDSLAAPTFDAPGCVDCDNVAESCTGTPETGCAPD